MGVLFLTSVEEVCWLSPSIVTGSARIIYVSTGLISRNNKIMQWVKYSWNQKKSVILFGICFTMEEDDNSIIYGSIMIPKAREV